MKTLAKNTSPTQAIPRPPVVAVLGHVDHGKSTLLDYIRKTSVVEKEAGGITQHLGAYEVVHKSKDGKEHPITFLDTPGHEAFRGIRSRGAQVADIGILVVSAEEGVKPQTIEALACVQEAKLPYIVAITKIDKPTANVERTKQSLAEHQIYVEGYGGDVPLAALSSKTGEGVGELLDLILLVAELHDVCAHIGAPLSAFIIESNVDKKKGIYATLIIKDGELKKGDILVAEGAYTSTRRLENVKGEPVERGRAGMSAVVIGWSAVPHVGAGCRVAESKREAEELALRAAEARAKRPTNTATTQLEEAAVLPLVLKADTGGSLEAIEQEVTKYATEKVPVKIVSKGVGAVNESDLKASRGSANCVIVGFNVSVDPPAQSIIERGGVTVRTFDVIYALGEWIAQLVHDRMPKVRTTTVKANARILKIFTTEKDRQVIGGKVFEGELRVGDEFRILRRDAEIGKGKVRELQRHKEKVSAVPKDNEFGALVSTSIEIMPSDRIEAIAVTEQ